MPSRYLIIVFCALLGCAPVWAENRSMRFDKTLRIDYIFSGDAARQEIALEELKCMEGWAGRQHRLDTVPLRGNGRIVMRDARSGTVLYVNTFSSLFQEWTGTEEATRTRKAFENVFLLPMPGDSARVTVELYDFKGKTTASLTHTVCPDDILIRPVGGGNRIPHKYIRRGGDPSEAIDIAIVAEGYTADEMDKFYEHARIADQALFSYEPFKSYAKRFNVVAVGAASQDSGVSIPGKRDWKDTALGSHFDTFYSDRYLTTLRIRTLHDMLAGIPYEHIIILANTDNYGGGGIYNSYTLTTARHSDFRPVVVHEFGHSFAGLADEYYYDDQYVEFYYPEVEPWEQNITTLKDFSAKWQDMLPEGTAYPTELIPGSGKIGVYEGAGYQSKGVFRSYEDCRMKTNTATEFCPVCRRALERLIKFYTE